MLPVVHSRMEEDGLRRRQHAQRSQQVFGRAEARPASWETCQVSRCSLMFGSSGGGIAFRGLDPSAAKSSKNRGAFFWRFEPCFKGGRRLLKFDRKPTPISRDKPADSSAF